MGRSYAALTGSLEELAELRIDEMDEVDAEQALDCFEFRCADRQEAVEIACRLPLLGWQI